MIFALIFSYPTFYSYDIPFFSLIILFALLLVFLCALLEYLLCFALFLSNNMCLLLQSFLPLPLLLFILVCLLQLLLSYILSFSVQIVFFSLFPFSAVSYSVLIVPASPIAAMSSIKMTYLFLPIFDISIHTYFYTAIFTYYFFSNFIYLCAWCRAHNGSYVPLFYNLLFYIFRVSI